MKRVALILLLLGLSRLSFAAEFEIIDLLHLNAREFAASLSGGAHAADTLHAAATDFALDVLEDVSRRGRGQSSMPDTLAYSRAGSVPGSASDLSVLLPPGLSGPPVAAPNRNALIVRGTPEAIDRLREVIAMLDVPTPMVNVDLLMDQISTERARQIAPHLRAWGPGGDLSAGGLQPPGLGYAAGNVSGLLGYGSGSARRQTLTGANVTGMSGTPMVISAGEVRPRIVASYWYDGWGQRRVEYYPEAAFAGVTLWVLPTVHADDSVTMVLRPVLSEFAGAAPRAGAGDIVRRTLVETTVRVPDGRPLVIGGLDRHVDEVSRRFPATQGSARSDSSSVITVTPTIIRMRGTGR